MCSSDLGRLHAAGPPEQVLTPETVQAVFGLSSEIITDPISGKPLMVPRGRHHDLARERPVPLEQLS